MYISLSEQNLKMEKRIQYSLHIALPLLLGAIAGYFTTQNIATWYVYLHKPSFNPPNYLFGPVWTTLYLLMGISYNKLLKQPNIHWRLNAIYYLQLMLNFCWSFIFFYYHQLGWALVEIILLWSSILTMIILFYKTSKWAALLNVPYLLWVSFATLLTYSIYTLN